ncbi:hypothetical protein ACQCVK_13405 [Rossellomorea vietnamensis]|uniref:hypothetical protein n=1 Tax=Rossellomorea vietnamensis TaxID=218284 RepID=UPI003CE9CE70
MEICMMRRLLRSGGADFLGDMYDVEVLRSGEADFLGDMYNAETASVGRGGYSWRYV